MNWDSIDEIASMQPEPVIPPWLRGNGNGMMPEARATYKSIPKAFNSSGVANAYDEAIGNTTAVGGLAASNAGNEAVARSNAEGGQVNSAAVFASTVLPFLKQKADLGVSKETAMADMAMKAEAARAQLATVMGNLRSAHLTTLANYYLNAKSQSANWVESQQAGARANAEQAARFAQINRQVQRESTPVHTTTIDWGNGQYFPAHYAT